MLPVPDKRKLTDMQAAFVEAFSTNGGDKEAAAITAGFAPANALTQALSLLRKPHVMHAVMEQTVIEVASNAPKAVKRLSSLLNARSEYVALQAAQDLLDRAGIRAPERVDHRISGEITVNIDLS